MHTKNRKRSMEKIRKKTKKKALGWESAMLHHFDVYTNTGIIIGLAYVVSYFDGRMSEPMLVNFQGEQLPGSTWYQMKMTEYKPCIVPRGIQ